MAAGVGDFEPIILHVLFTDLHRQQHRAQPVAQDRAQPVVADFVVAHNEGHALHARHVLRENVDRAIVVRGFDIVRRAGRVDRPVGRLPGEVVIVGGPAEIELRRPVAAGIAIVTLCNALILIPLCKYL